MYGSTVGVTFLRTFDAERRLEAHAMLTVADGRVWEEDEVAASLPTGAMAPVQFPAGSVVRRTLDGYATIDVNVRRMISSNITAFVTTENALDRRYRTINPRAYTNPEELIGAPQNPRRITVGVDWRLTQA
jgi:outer membrane cobalamin receptor